MKDSRRSVVVVGTEAENLYGMDTAYFARFNKKKAVIPTAY